VIEILHRILAFHWRRSGGVIRTANVLGSRVWFAEFAPAVPVRSARERRTRWPGRERPRRSQPTVILLHGLGATGASFHPVIDALRRGYRVIVPDLPGYGLSRPPRGREFLSFAELLDTVELFVERVAPRGAYLAGNSMGGWIAAKLASRRPELARGIALLNPGGPGLKAEDWTDFTRVIAAEDADAIRQFVTRLFHRPPFGYQLLGRELRRIMRAPPVAQLVCSLQAEDFLTAEELASVDCPSVLIWGENDRLIPEACRAFYLEKLPYVRYEPMAECGHCPQLECPRKTAEILLRLPRLRRRVRAAQPTRRRTVAHLLPLRTTPPFVEPSVG
jgi:pimeloyl-ACP methyl ester carboxylesterase